MLYITNYIEYLILILEHLKNAKYYSLLWEKILIIYEVFQKPPPKTFFMTSWSIFMNLYHTGLSELYKEIETLGDPLTGISDRIDFERIRPILSDLFTNDTDKGGRPNYDPILMVNILLLQQWYNLSDPRVEREIRDRISFMNFLGYPEKLPDRNTIWYFR